MTEVWFYHLERQRLEHVLPGLLTKCRSRNWNCVIQSGSEETLRLLDDHLWNYDDTSFLPHGTKADGHAPDQPIWLTTDTDNPNRAAVRLLVDRAEADDIEPYERVIFPFDGLDEAALAHARSAWKEAKSAGHEVQYWKQGENGGWQKQA